MNSFLFIIPLTPKRLLTEERQALQELALLTLLGQSYAYWTALLVGETDLKIDDPRFVQISFEGHKEEKLQCATEYIIDRNLQNTHIIRLDDDDIFNPTLLESLKQADFDLYVDKFQTFWDPANGRVANKIFYWFPNTCIHKAANALSEFGDFPPGDYIRKRSKARLIENEHNDFHKFYLTKNVVFAKKNNPVYLRSLNLGSITSQQSSDFRVYLSDHGIWKSNKYEAFSFLSKQNAEDVKYIKQGFRLYIRHTLDKVRALRNYKKIVFDNAN